eukprot:TRINITY_DN336_c0_g2_i1.p1 TRINITY_DN336_c0_g2~~TRINITY_DN336_c0_g2_i1.p1  ORF type:complete len:476 (+),score=63.19 TRINITY_DN336_c0_g2_i1:38-1429(+)
MTEEDQKEPRLPIDGIRELPVEDAKQLIEGLKKELEKRVEEPPEMFDSKAEIMMMEKCLEAVTEAAGNDGNQSHIDACKSLLNVLSEKEKKEGPQHSGDRPSEPPKKGDRGLNFATSEVPCDTWNIPASRRWQTLCVMCVNFFTGLPVFLALYVMMYFIPMLWPVLCMYNLWMLWDIYHSGTPRSHKKWFRNSRFWKVFAFYFPIRLRVENPTLFKKLDESGNAKNYLFVLHPHGVHSFGAFINFATNANGLDDIFTQLTMYVQTLGVQFKLPLWRELVRIGACGDASRGTLRKVLTGKPGDSALLVVGGAEEALDASPGTFDLIIKKRKGFVRIALQTGSCLVPAFSYGENDVYKTFCRDPETRSKLKWIQHKLGFAIPLFMGRGIFNYHFGLLPHRRQITTVIGDPIHVEKWEGEFNVKDPALMARVDEVHEEYMKQLQGLYDRNKNIYGLSRYEDMKFTQ